MTLKWIILYINQISINKAPRPDSFLAGFANTSLIVVPTIHTFQMILEFRQLGGLS